MVLETLKESLTTFTDTVTSPVETITNVTSSMKKTVMWPDVDFLERIADFVQVQNLQKTFATRLRVLKRTIGKTSIATTKKKKLQWSLTAASHEIEHITSSDQYIKTAQKILKQFEQKIKDKQLVSWYEKDEFVIEKTKLTDSDSTTLVPIIQEEQIKLKEQCKEAQQAYTKQLMLPCSSTYNHKEQRKVFHDDWRKQIDALIDDEYAISRQQKKLSYSIKELERQTNLLDKAQSEKRKWSLDKDLVRRMNAAKQKIEVLTKKEIPWLFLSISKALDLVIKDEKTISTIWEKHESSYASHEKVLHTYLSKNLQETKKIITKESKERKTWNKSLETLITKLHKAKTNIEDTLPKVVGKKQVDLVRTYVEQEDTHSAAIYTKELDVYGSYYHQMTSHQKDILVSQEIVEDILQRWYTLVWLGKERITQLKILNTNKKRHATKANDIWSSLIRINNTLGQDIWWLITTAKKQVEVFKKQTLDYQKEIGSHTKEVRELRKKTKELHSWIQEINELKERANAVYSHNVLSSYIDILQRMATRNKTHISTLTKTKKTLENTNKSAEKEKNFFDKKQQLSAAEKKKLTTAAETHHASELALDIITHHIETEEEHEKDMRYLVKAYTKQMKWEQKKINFYTKLCNKLYDKIKKNTVCKQLVLSPKKLSGTDI